MSQSPFTTIPQTPETQQLERLVEEALGELMQLMDRLYGADGPLAEPDGRQAIAKSTGTIMMRLVDVAARLLAQLQPPQEPAQVKGDLAILLARTAAYLVRELPMPILLRLVPYMVRELRTCAGVAADPPAPADMPAQDDLPFTPLRTPSCNITLTAPGCYDVPAFRGDGFFSSWWRPSPEALAAMNAGVPFKLTMLSDGWPPVRLEVDAL